MKYLVDTNICIYVIKNQPVYVFERFRQYEVGEIGVSIITACELAFGVEKTGSERNRLTLSKFLTPLPILPLDEDVMWHYGKLRANLHNAGTPIGALDMLIAAHALSRSLILVTNNTKEFSRIKELKLDNWV